MKELLLSVFLIATPAYAGIHDGDTQLLVLHEDGTVDVYTTKIENIQSPDQAVEWKPVNGDFTAQNYTIQDGKLTYAPPPVVVDTTVLAIRDFVIKNASNSKIDGLSFSQAQRILMMPNKDSRDKAWVELLSEMKSNGVKVK